MNAIHNKKVFDGISGKIKVSAALVNSTVELLENFDIDDIPPDLIQLYCYVLHVFNRKKAKHEYRKELAMFAYNQDVLVRAPAHLGCDMFCCGIDAF